jgi:AraC-like DNA-binding protein
VIQNLNKFSFAAFGRVLPESAPDRGFPQEPEWSLEHLSYASEPVWVNRVEHMPIYLDIERGMTVLAVARDGEELEYFYLDKPVSINPGILFAIVPRGGCTVLRAIHATGAATELFPLDAGKLPRNIMRQIEIGGIYTLFYQEKERGFFFKGEEHDLYELVYVDKGALHNVVNGTDTVLRQGEMMVYSPGLWHMQHADLDTEVSFITVTFELLRGELGTLVNRRIPLDADGTALLRRMLVERDKNDRYSGDLIVCVLQMLLLGILRNGEKAETRLKTPASLLNENSIVNAALTYISANARKKLSVPLVAKSCNVSVSRLTKLFQERLAITPGEYIRRVKLEESRALIKAGEGNVSQIAELLQYSTVQHFSRQFKAKFGVSPSEFAKSVR